MLRSPDHAVIGAADLAATTAFFTALGFGQVATGRLDQTASHALYGLPGPSEERLLAVEGAVAGHVRLVATPHGPPARGPYGCGPLALDVYTTDVERSVAVATRAGARCGPVGRYAVGDRPVAEVRVVGPDGVAVVFIQIEGRRPSVLDHQPDRLHSEAHSIVWAVPDVDAAAAPWRAAGLQTLADLTFSEPAVGTFLELPRLDAPIRLQLLCDADVAPARLEVLAFTEDGDGALPPPGPLRAGLQRVAFVVDDLAAATATLPDVRLAPPVPTSGALGGARVASGTAPGGIAVELWQPDG